MTSDKQTASAPIPPSVAMWEQLFRRSAKPTQSLQGQIREMLVDAILTGVLTPGDSIPSSRELAKMLGVGRITVVMAYQQLTEEAFLLSRERKGHFIHPDVLQGRTTNNADSSLACKARHSLCPVLTQRFLHRSGH